MRIIASLLPLLLILFVWLPIFAGAVYALFLGIKIMRWFIKKNDIHW